ncbi:CAZyme family GH78 [Penicillium roqueforti]|uniref:Six-hairpin glycosidase-like n=1 Tax=Penicillium roqueforti (strain FM164) TaxID=1365484 RepID=W6QGP4_PENRF|nr:CAZyme family GH78 [Penicillium roqueforti]CDM33354.1 Six-hairpin glycosidase-like [Penicillium roqueforti FM164]KAF9250787.1 CAZyme family GH78 [Penicillium roqueforti]KAI1830853.1 CAZyme family GH78 [Penicillium roqueforti]KAI2707994.1 CAZyme family GH78 [Penicillium roqueforti]KAI2735990.1 CAZyme family GH78 [Penicillium roqueforti]
MAQSYWCSVVLILWSLFSLSVADTCWRDTSCSGPTNTAFSGPWEENIYAPASRTVRPVSTLSELKTNAVADSSHPYKAKLYGNGSLIVFDFGIEVGGIVHLDYTSTGSGALGLAFTEAKNWIGEWSDSSNALYHDGALYANISSTEKGTYIMPDKYLRGGFRYLTVFLITDNSGSVQIDDLSLEVAFKPTWSNLRAYQGYFHCNDELLNRIWYSGAYTLQTNEVPVTTGRVAKGITSGWANNGTLGPGDTIIVDGAKRDRAVWPGDMGIAVPSAFVSLGDLESVKNALQIMYNTQNKTTGAFDESGPPLSQKDSDTYHMWSMIGTYNYVLYTNDTDFLLENWASYLHAMEYIYGKVTYPSGLLNVTGTRDWARWQQGYNNSEAQMILYHTLQTGASLSLWAGDSANLSSTWSSQAVNLKKAINTYCWDESYGAFKDNATDTSLHPQDANSMAIIFGVVDEEHTASISEKLLKNWTPIGAVAPELPENIASFISSFEIQSHFIARKPARALDLIRRSWGWYINNPNGTESTVIEGYLRNGTFGYRMDRGYGYDPSYVSHAHGWSSGPTSALTEFVVGLSVVSPLGLTWKIAPQFGDLDFAEAGFVTSLGKFKASWALNSSGYVLTFSAPKGTIGNVTLPYVTASKKPLITIDGKQLIREVAYADDTAIFEVTGGSHKVIVK